MASRLRNWFVIRTPGREGSLGIVSSAFLARLARTHGSAGRRCPYRMVGEGRDAARERRPAPARSDYQRSLRPPPLPPPPPPRLPPPPPPPPPPPLRCGRSSASFTRRARPSSIAPFMAPTAAASCALPMVTKPKPRDWPLSRSLTMWTSVTSPDAENAARRVSGTTLNG